MTTHPSSGAPRSFEEAWPQISGALNTMLRRDGVSPSLVEDIVQETGCRLLSRWARLDADSSMLPLAITIARNLVVDHHRRYSRMDGPEEFSRDLAPDDVEANALARIQLGAVHRSLRELTPRYRNLLLAEAGYIRSDESAGPATRVARTRARQGLKALLERRPDVAWVGFPFTGVFRAAARWQRSTVIRSDWAMLGQAAAGLGIFIFTLVSPGAAPGGPGEESLTERPSQERVISDETEPAFVQRGARPASKGALVLADAKSPSRAGSVGQTEGGSLLPAAGGLEKGSTSSGGGFGVHGFDESAHGSTSVMDEPVEWRYEFRYRNPQCVRRLAQGKPTAGCDTSPEADASASASHGDSEIELDPDS